MRNRPRSLRVTCVVTFAVMKALPNYGSQILPTFNALTVNSSNQVVALNVFYAGGDGGGAYNQGLTMIQFNSLDIPQLERFLDIPWCKGDEYHIQKLVWVLRASR